MTPENLNYVPQNSGRRFYGIENLLQISRNMKFIEPRWLVKNIDIFSDHVLQPVLLSNYEPKHDWDKNRTSPNKNDNYLYNKRFPRTNYYNYQPRKPENFSLDVNVNRNEFRNANSHLSERRSYHEGDSKKDDQENGVEKLNKLSDVESLDIGSDEMHSARGSLNYSDNVDIADQFAEKVTINIVNDSEKTIDVCDGKEITIDKKESPLGILTNRKQVTPVVIIKDINVVNNSKQIKPTEQPIKDQVDEKPGKQENEIPVKPKKKNKKNGESKANSDSSKIESKTSDPKKQGPKKEKNKSGSVQAKKVENFSEMPKRDPKIRIPVEKFEAPEVVMVPFDDIINEQKKEKSNETKKATKPKKVKEINSESKNINKNSIATNNPPKKNFNKANQDFWTKTSNKTTHN